MQRRFLRLLGAPVKCYEEVPVSVTDIQIND